MRVRKAFIAGIGVDPNALATPNLRLPLGERGVALPATTPYELSFALTDLRVEFFRAYFDWIADMREHPDPDDELEARLRELAWPPLGALAEAEPETFAVVLLAMGKELLADLEHGRDPLVPVRWTLASVDEVELCGRRIVLRGDAVGLVRARRPTPPS